MRDWEQLKSRYLEKGWICDVDDDERIGFIFPEDEDHEWFHDYNKKNGSCFMGNGKTKINLRVIKE